LAARELRRLKSKEFLLAAQFKFGIWHHQFVKTKFLNFALAHYRYNNPVSNVQIDFWYCYRVSRFLSEENHNKIKIILVFPYTFCFFSPERNRPRI
jgi:hypothetical protein